MAPLAGWKDILRPIRDGYRHLFPTPDTGPTPAERARQQELDRLKGFAYFDTFDQLEAWTDADSDPLQRSNTPLLPRHRAAFGTHMDGSFAHLKTHVMLCHDYAGNYHDYEAAQGVGVEGLSYACEYLQFVESFIYFSHKLICVPPPSWTNTLHRNGVEVLGTVLVERQTPNIERLLQHHRTSTNFTDEVYFPMAKKLAVIAQHFGFDGWLINIEKPFPTEHWDVNLLEQFLLQLRKELGPRSKLIWYDALTTSNKVNYQNALTQNNLSFSQACGNILTNYSWKESYAWDSQKLAMESGMSPRNVFFGIDVWAQNTTKLTHPRITYPEKGGGGTNTGIAVHKLHEVGLSAAIFAPAWTFEHFPGLGEMVERAVWDGHGVPDSSECSCGNTHQQHPDNPYYPITKFARESPSGSEMFFHTDFSRAFTSHSSEETDMLYDGKELHSQLAAQSILPHLVTGRPNTQGSINIPFLRLEDLRGRTQLVVGVLTVHFEPAAETPDRIYESERPLFNLDMPANGTLHFWIRARFIPPASGAMASICLRYASGQSVYLPLSDSGLEHGIHEVVVSPDGGDVAGEDRLLEIGVQLKAPEIPESARLVKVLEIMEILIAPPSNPDFSGSIGIENLRVEMRNNSYKEHIRLCWGLADKNGEERERDERLPYSDITGPFAYFLVRVGGVESRAYALEWVVSERLSGLFEGAEGTDVEVVGIGFDGRELARCGGRLRI